MPYSVTWSPRFVRAVRRFLRSHPDLQTRFDRVLAELAQDPNQPHLDLHALRGELQGYHAVRLTYGYRLILVPHHGERRITLVDIGSHDDVYR